MIDQTFFSLLLPHVSCSYVWQTIYCLGLACTLIYLIFKKALAAWVFIVVELALGVIFICVKIYFEQVAPKGKNTSFALVSSCFGGVSFEQPRKSIVELLSTVKEVLHSMSFMETHQSIEVVGDTENEPASLRCIVHAYIYMNEFMVELRYSKETAQLLIQVTAHRHLENLSELANRIDQQITLSLPGSSMLHHGAT